jgi:hypothetical protein
VPPRQTLTYLRQISPEVLLLSQEIYNHRAALQRDLRQGQSPIDALLLYLENKGTYCRSLVDSGTSRLVGLFIACPESIQHLQFHHDVLLIDNTYSTNRFNMPLMDIIGQSPMPSLLCLVSCA